jgi:O-antigen ligase
MARPEVREGDDPGDGALGDRRWLHLGRFQLRPLAGFALAALAVVTASQAPVLGLALLVLAGFLALARLSGTPLLAPAAFLISLYAFSPRYVLGGAQLTPAVLAAAGCAILLVASRLSPESGKQTMRSPLFVMVALYWVVSVLSYAIGVMRPLQGLELARADRQVLLLTLLAAVSVLIIEVAPSMPAIRLLSGVYVSAVAVLAVVAVLQGLAGVDLVEVLRLPGFAENRGIGYRRLDRLGVTRVRGTTTHPIEAGTLLAASLPLTLHIGSYAKTAPGRLGGRVVSLLAVLAALLTLSRSAMVGLVLALVMVLAGSSSTRRFRLVLAGVLSAGAAALAFPQVLVVISRLLSDFFGSDISGADIGARTEDYDVVRGLVGEHPVLGRGFGTFDPVVNFATDNQVLKTLVEGGVLGLLVLLLLVVVALREAGIGAAAARSENDRDLARSIRNSFALVALSMLFYDGFSFLIAAGTFFFLAGLCGAVGVAGRATAGTSADGASHPERNTVGA